MDPVAGETLVGREQELGRIDAALEALDADGQPAARRDRGRARDRQVAACCGELRERAEARGHIVLRGQAAEFERDRPVRGPDRDGRPLPRAQLDDGLGAAPGPLRDELGADLPRARRRRERPAAVGDERYRSHRAVRALLEPLAERQAAGDRARRPALGRRRDDRAARGPAAPRPGRPGADHPRLPARERPHDAGRGAGGAAGRPRIELGQLSESEAADAARRRRRRGAAAIYRHGGGNPFYLEQLARLDQPRRLERGRGAESRRRGPHRRSRPRSPRSSRSLSPEAGAPARGRGGRRRALRPGRRRRRSRELEREVALERARRAARPRPGPRRPSVPRRFIFRHPLVRRSVYESIGGGSRLAAHARAARVASPRAEPPPTERAHHVEQAASAGRLRRRSRSCSRPAEAAAGRAPAVAARWLDGALRLLRDDDRERQVSVRVALASALRSSGELERCRETLLETIELVGEDDEPRRLRADGLVRRRRALARASRGRPPAPDLRAWEELDDHGPPRARRCRSSWRSTASTRSISSRRWRWGPARWRPGAGSARR